MSKSNNKNLTLFALTWPIFFEILLHMLMGNADTLMLSQYSDDAVAAVGVANQIISVIIVMFGFISTGSAIVIAQHLGAKEHFKAKEVASTALTLNLFFSLILGFIIFLFSESLVKIIGLPSHLLNEAVLYLKIVGGLSFFQALIMTVSVIIRTYGYSKDTMYVTLGINILNVIGNYLFIFGPLGIPVLGVTGVAISTVISKAIGVVIVLHLLFKRVDRKLILKDFIILPFEHVKNLIKIGVPAAGEHLSYNTSQLVITYFITMLGTEALTTKVYTQNIMMFIFVFAIAIGQGNQILIGHMVGADHFQKAYHRCLKSLKIAMIASVSMAILFTFSSTHLFRIFTDNQNIIQTGSLLILLTIILEPGRSFNLVIINSLRAAGDVKFPVYIGILFMWGISVPLSYLFAITFNLGLAGIWVGFIVDEWCRGIIMLVRWKSRVWQNMKLTKMS